MERPDLEEFLSALDGFLDKPATTPQDPTYLRFLEIFCRSIGATEGHLLAVHQGNLSSVISIGLGDKFSRDFNAARAAGNRAACPLDRAFFEKKVVAIVELKKATGLPAWFLNVMDRCGFHSLLAVPLLAHTQAVGVLCAYYHDACLFDQGTLDRMMVIGRMVGSAVEKSMAAANPSDEGKAVDEFLSYLSSKPFTRIHVYAQLARIAGPALNLSGALCGPVRKTHDEHALTVNGIHGVPAAAISNRYVLPPLLEKKILTSRWPASAKAPAGKPPFSSPKDWGSLATLIQGSVSGIACESLFWQNRFLGAFVGWRLTGGPITSREESLLVRLGGLASLAISASN